MSRRDSRWPVAMAVLMGMVAVAPAMAQTIADYSRVQRTALENAMAQAAKAAGLAASSSASAPSAASVPSSVRPLAIAEPPVPVVHVSGVFAWRDVTVAEVSVDATAYLVAAGQGLPGTAWRVTSVATDRVVLERRVADEGPATARTARRVFSLPELR